MKVLRFLLDQSADARLIAFLIALGHDAKRVGRDYPAGLPDRDVLDIAVEENRILVADDRDFGELVVRLGRPHAGVILLRLGRSADLATRIARLDHVLTNYADRLDRLLVVTRDRVRVCPP
jgi:predicted nuclease of predicted toxin-antitoxin system